MMANNLGKGQVSSSIPKRAGIHYCSSYVVHREIDIIDIMAQMFIVYTTRP